MLRSGKNAVGSSVHKRKFSFEFLATALALSCSVATLTSTSVRAEDDTEWTMTLISHVNKAIGAYNRGDYRTAKDEYRTSIGLSPKTAEFYDGLMYSSLHTGEWDQVAFAANEIARLEPSRKAEVAFLNGMALYRLNRFDDAVPLLRLALQFNGNNSIDDFHPTPKDEALVGLSHPENHVATPTLVDKPKPVIRAIERLNRDEYLSLETACTRTELIVLCTYEGIQKGTEINYNNPPITIWNRGQILKGPPTNPKIPIWFEFHDYIKNGPVPKDWKFDEKAMMPEKGSKWIIFIENFYAKNGAYTTYQGSYGRQPATEANLNQLYSILDKYNMRNVGRF